MSSQQQPSGLQAAIDLLEEESRRQFSLRDERQEANDFFGAVGAREMADHYRIAAVFLKEKMACLARKA